MRVVTRHLTFGQRRRRSATIRAGRRRPARSCRGRAGPAARRSRSATPSTAPGDRAVGEAERPGDRRRDEGRVAHGIEGHEPDPVREAVRGCRGDLERQPGLARPARTGEGQQPGRWRSSPAASATSRSRPTKVVSCVGRLLGRASSERSGGKSAGRPSTTSWASRSGARRSLSRCSPEVAQARRRRQLVRRRGPASRRRAGPGRRAPTRGDPRRPVDGVADDVAPDRLDLARVEPHPDPDLAPVRPRLRRRARAARRPPPTTRIDGAAGRARRTSRPRCPARSPPCAANASRRSTRCRSRTSRYGPVPSCQLEAWSSPRCRRTGR